MDGNATLWILLVDGDERYAERLEDELPSERWVLIRADDPVEAVDVMGKHPWSLVLVGRPRGADGPTFLGTLRRVVPQLPVALIAENPGPILNRRMRQRGALDCVQRARSGPALRRLLESLAVDGDAPRRQQVTLDETGALALSGRHAALGDEWMSTSRAAVRGFRGSIQAGGLDLPGRGDLLPRLQDLAARPEAGADEVTAVLEGDPLVVASVLHAANVADRRFATPTLSVRDACVRLGNQMVLAIGQQIAIRSALRLHRDPWHDFGAAWWTNSEATSHLARVLAPRVGATPQDGFLAGLLTNLGELALLAEAERWDDSGVVEPLVVVLKEVTSSEHARLGEEVVSGWVFEPRWSRIVRDHHKRSAPSPLAPLALLCWGLVLEQGLTYIGHDPSGSIEAHLGRNGCDLRRLMSTLRLDATACREAAQEVVTAVSVCCDEQMT